MKPTWRESRFLVIVLLINSVTRRGPTILVNAVLGTTARGGSLFCCSTIAILALCPSGFIKEADSSVDVIDASHNLRGSVPVKNSTLYPATLPGNGS